VLATDNIYVSDELYFFLHYYAVSVKTGI